MSYALKGVKGTDDEQELLNCNYSFWFYSRLSFPLSHDSGRQRQTWVKPVAVITV